MLFAIVQMHTRTTNNYTDLLFKATDDLIVPEIGKTQNASNDVQGCG